MVLYKITLHNGFGKIAYAPLILENRESRYDFDMAYVKSG